MPVRYPHLLLWSLLICLLSAPAATQEACVPGGLAAAAPSLNGPTPSEAVPTRLPPAGSRVAAPIPSLEIPARERKRLADRREWLIYAGGIALLASADRSTLTWFDADRFEREAGQGRRSKRGDLAAGVPLLVELALPYLIDGRYGRQTTKLALGATLNALVIVQPLKLVFGKERPEQARGAIVFHGPGTGHHSFPSGHTAIAFAVATVYADRYPRWKIPIYLLATGVGLARVEAGRHYLSDVFAGAGIGILAGRASLRGGGRLLSWRF